MVGIMNGDDVYAGIHQQIESFRASDRQREALLDGLLKRYQELEAAYQELNDDHNNEKQGRREWQRKATALERKLSAAQDNLDAAPFALALIDGDGAIFEEYLLAQGSSGGSDAAHKLHTGIREHIQELYPGAGHWSVVVNIYANLEGLSRKLVHCDMVKTVGEMHAFLRAFTLNQPLFNFIDVGSGKERADHKIKETFRLFVANHQCKHIIFGGCHDNGYLPNLDTYKHDPSVSSKISLLETYSMQPGFMAMNFNNLKLPTVFRSSPLPERRESPLSAHIKPAASFPSTPVQYNMPQPFPPAPPAVAAYQSPAPVSRSPVQVLQQAPSAYKATPSPPPNTTAGAQPPGTTSWATVGKNGVADKNISIAPAKPVAKKAILLNMYDQRIDPPLPRAERTATEAINARINKTGKLCNNHYINGRCDNSQCSFDHKAKINEAERLALRHKARTLRCGDGWSCRKFDCFLGHHCPWGKKCTYGTCWFEDTHDMDMTVRMKMNEDEQIEILGNYST